MHNQCSNIYGPKTSIYDSKILEQNLLISKLMHAVLDFELLFLTLQC